MAGGRRVAVLVLLVVTATVTAAGPASAVPSTDSTVTRITLAENGTATWEVQVRTRLPTSEDVDEYERFQERFRENTSEYLGSFSERMRGVVRESANATGRPMEARGFDAETSVQAVPRRWGVVTYEFTWVHFAAHDGQALTVGDVFQGEFYLTENDTFQVTGPDDYAVRTVDPQPAEHEPGVVRWFGQRAFDDERPMVRYEPETGAGTDPPGSTGGTDDSSGTDGTSEPGETDGVSTAGATTAPNGQSNGPGTNGSQSDSAPRLPAALAVLVVGILAVGGYRYYRQSGGFDGVAGRPDGTDDSAAGAEASRQSASAENGETAGSGPRSSSSGPGAGDGANSTNDTGGTADTADDAGIDPNPILTDEDRVLELLADNDGQLHQSEIVEGLDWSKSKTSRVLSDMAESGAIEKLRIGRENVIRLEESIDSSGPEE